MSPAQPMTTADPIAPTVPARRPRLSAVPAAVAAPAPQAAAPAAPAAAKPAAAPAAQTAGGGGTVRRLSVDPRTTLIVPKGVLIRGDIVTTALYLAGEIEGSVFVRTGQAVIAATGRIVGRLQTKGPAAILGSIEGKGLVLRVGGELDLAASSRVVGDVEYSHITLREGATVDGRLTKLAG